ncbi:glycosyltransferase family 4 protein [Candidatus Daviesbacteria bacterium]|nr:glycosyltransferase family 4 protein [Candidatus Daviesbacteria bacterium]
MIIGFDGSRAFSNQRTGTENYSYQLLKHLAKIDTKNHYLIYLRPASTKDLGQSNYLEKEKGWPQNFQFKVLEYFRLWTQSGLAFETFKQRLDLLFVPAHTLPIIHKPGLKTVLTVHDLGSEYLPRMHQLKQRLYLSVMQRYQLKTATKIIAVSKATRDDLVAKIGINPSKIVVIYEGYNKNLFKQVKSDTLVNSLSYLNLKPKTYLLFVGTVQPRKNLKRLILAYNQFLQLNNNQILDLVIVGSRGWLSDEIFSLPKKLGIESKVRFLGYIPDARMPALYSGAVGCVFPSLFEGFGLPILEAQACGCPVLTSSVSSMPEVAGSGAILVDPYSIDDIVKGMEKLQSEGIRKQLVKKGFENTKRFSWEKCAIQTLGVLEKL